MKSPIRESEKLLKPPARPKPGKKRYEEYNYGASNEDRN